MPAPDAKLLQHLNEVHALEAGLVQTLAAHIAMTPEGAYRDLLERHLRETRDQTARIEQRLGELGVTRNPLQLAYGLAQTVVGQVLPAAKLPLDLLRGPSGEEKLLKNAKDEASTEALEIATYDGLEAIATALGDEKTATLAREHRTQEEVFLAQLREQIPQLAADVVDADVRGTSHFDPATTGAAQTARKVTGRFRRAAEDAVDRAEDVVEDAADVAEDVAEEAADAVRGAAGRTADATLDLETADAGVTSDRSPGDDLPIEGYDSMTVDQILPRLADLDAQELAAIDGHERAGKERKRVLDRVQSLRNRRTQEELERIS